METACSSPFADQDLTSQSRRASGNYDFQEVTFSPSGEPEVRGEGVPRLGPPAGVRVSVPGLSVLPGSADGRPVFTGLPLYVSAPNVPFW